MQFEGVAGPVLLPDCRGLLHGLATCIPDWPLVTATAGGVAPVTRVARQKGGAYLLHSAHLDAAMADLPLASAVCAVIADLVQDYCDGLSIDIGLHCGAFRLGGKLVLVTGPRRAGKSTLISRLSAEPDVEIFCDDVLPIDRDGQAIALGVAPRLRLPLPADAGTGFRAHVARHMGPADDRYGYLLSPGLAKHGTRAAPEVLLALDRREAPVAARLHRMDESDAVMLLLRQSISRLEGADAALDLATRMVRGMTVLRLVYSDLEQAVGLLRETLAVKGANVNESSFPAPLPPLFEPALPEPADPDLVFQRRKGIAVRQMGEAAFLWQPGEATLWHLNAVARAVWTMLEIPSSARDLAEILAELFADVPAPRLMEDCALLCAQMAEEGMILPA